MNYSVSVSDNENGPWTMINNGTLSDPRRRSTMELETFDLDNKAAGRYVKFDCTSKYGDRCCLNYIAVE